MYRHLKRSVMEGVDMEWMIPANNRMYDHEKAFATNDQVYWTQKAGYEVGDIVYIYCTKPIQRIRYKCEVVEGSVPFSKCDDASSFWRVMEAYDDSKGGVFACLKLLDKADVEDLSLERLKEHGLKTPPRGPMRVKPELLAYIDSIFDDQSPEGFFPDVSDGGSFHEGHVKTVTVNKYERSSIARRKCIEYHGLNCLICGLNFKERYGDIGDGFIHIHHLRPLHTIGEDYVVDYKEDLIPVCPNCHAMIHRIPNGDEMTLSELIEILGKR